MDSCPKDELPKVELPNDENKLFDVDDDIGASTIPDLSVASEDDEEEVIPNNVWDHLLIPYLNFLHFTLMEKVLENGKISKHGQHGTVLSMGSETLGTRRAFCILLRNFMG